MILHQHLPKNLFAGFSFLAELDILLSAFLLLPVTVFNQSIKFPAITDQLAKITKNYYDALIKAGFAPDAALKIITSKQLISVDRGCR